MEPTCSGRPPAEKSTRPAQRLLAETQIKAARPAAKPYKLSDAGGLVLLVQPNGAKLWRYRFWLHDKEGVLSLGRYPDVSLKRARELHREARSLVADGINPVHQRKDLKIEASREESRKVLGTFQAVASAWEEKVSIGCRPATNRQRHGEVKNHLLPVFKDRFISSITRLEVSTVLLKLNKQAPESTRNIRRHLAGIFEHAIDIGFLGSNPVPSRRMLGTRQARHHPALPNSKLGQFLRDLDNSKVNSGTRTAMLLLLMTACRKNEVVKGKWSEIDFEKRSWTIPAERMKAKKDHWVPLSAQAVRLLQSLREQVPSSRTHLFPNKKDPSRAMADRSLNAVLERLNYGDEATPHGMRAAFSTHFNGIGANADVVEHCLAHGPANKVRAAYNRHAYEVERRNMLQEWANHLDAMRSSD